MDRTDRIQNLDTVRGVAVLGILAVNAITFAWPLQAMMAMQMLPMAVEGVLPTADRISAWVIEALFIDKFRTLFCLLFGISIFLIGGSGEDKAKSKRLRRRLAWLAVFGLIHGLAFWFGDILLLYAWAGLFAMLTRGLSAKTLLIIGASITGGLMFIQAPMGLLMPYMPAEISGAIEGHTAATTAKLVSTAQGVRESAGFAFMQNFKSWLLVQGMGLTLLVPAVFGLMVLGLGLFKAGFFHGRLSNKFYAAIFIFGMAALSLKGWAAWVEGSVAPELLPSRGLNVVGSALAVPIALAYATVIIKLPALFAWARPVGQMAFTTYLTQTLIMSSLFYMPWGPKLYGQMGPAEILGVVFAVWLLQIFAARAWLQAYRWGPFEWLWRSLTEGQRLPLTRTKA